MDAHLRSLAVRLAEVGSSHIRLRTLEVGNRLLAEDAEAGQPKDRRKGTVSPVAVDGHLVVDHV